MLRCSPAPKAAAKAAASGRQPRFTISHIATWATSSSGSFGPFVTPATTAVIPRSSGQRRRWRHDQCTRHCSTVHQRWLVAGPRRLQGWVTEETAAKYFGGQVNVGVNLGNASKGLTDVDLDCGEALAVAPYFLPRTAIFGRASKRNSHWLYATTLANTVDSAAVRFVDPTDSKSLVELRIGGGDRAAQTVFPGSIHPSGEPITSEAEGEPARIDDLQLRVRKLAAAALIARHYPDQGGRHHAAQVIGGLLARKGWKAGEIRVFAEAVATAGGSSNVADNARTAADSALAHEQGRRVFGFPEFVSIFGEKVAAKVAEWLNLNKDGSERPEAPPSNDEEPRQRKIIARSYVFRDPASIPRRAFIYGKHYSRGFLSGTFARGGRGKSLLVLTESIAIAINKPLLGFQPAEPCACWYWNGEDPGEEIERRIAAICQHHGIGGGSSKADYSAIPGGSIPSS